jgi:hypothetical protein
MTATERADYIKNKHRHIESYMSVPVKVSLLTKLKRLFK